MPKVTVPTIEELRATNNKYKLSCTEDELFEYQDFLKETVDVFNFVDETTLEADAYKYLETQERKYNFPDPSKNEYNAWYVRCELKKTKNFEDGGNKMVPKGEDKLAGKRVAVKDNICVAGIPMMNGSAIIEGFVPEDDATVVQRILNEGGIIIGKTTCEDMCFSGASYMTHKGPVLNPFNKERSAGGSSSGSGVVVATGEADMAVGCDQGGSVRIPASYCGIVGFKPTHGLVPYTGASSIMPAIDHLGPMTRNVQDCALLLEVMVSMEGRIIRIGILKEGVEACDQDVIEVFDKALEKLRTSKYLQISSASLPEHTVAGKYMTPLFYTGAFGSMFEGYGQGVGVTGYQQPSLVNYTYNGVKARASEMSVTLKQTYLLSDSIQQNHGPYHYAKASSLIQRVSKKYDELLTGEYDVLVMPTSNCLPCKLVPETASIKDRVGNAFGVNKNTAIFDGTGHPALSLNCGFSEVEKLPVGMMVVGKHWSETTVLNAASVIEKLLVNVQKD